MNTDEGREEWERERDRSRYHGVRLCDMTRDDLIRALQTVMQERDAAQADLAMMVVKFYKAKAA